MLEAYRSRSPSVERPRAGRAALWHGGRNARLTTPIANWMEASVNRSADLTLDLHTRRLRTILKSQYRAGLAMLREAIEQCPDDLWFDDEPLNAFWQIAYHTLYFTHLYLQPDVDAFRPWTGHQSEVQHEDGIGGPPDPESALPLTPSPYSRSEVLSYLGVCEAMVDDAVDALDLHSEESGFSWYPIPKLEHQLVNLRHLQHHTAQLADRLRTAAGLGVRWAGARRPTTGESAG
jgi:hypothetical protein